MNARWRTVGERHRWLKYEATTGNSGFGFLAQFLLVVSFEHTASKKDKKQQQGEVKRRSMYIATA